MAQLAREVILGQTSSCTDPEGFTRIKSARSLSRGSRLSLCADVYDAEATAPLITATTDVEAPLQHVYSNADADVFSRRVRLGINASWLVNVVLLASKAVTFVLSGSYAVLASAVDSLVDLLSQAILAIAEYQAARFDQRFPIGRTRMAEVSVLACATIMFVSTALVIRESIGSLWDGLHGRLFPLNVDAVLIGTLSAATALKLALYIYCHALRKNPIMVALSEDHLNDVMSNLAAIGGAAIAGNLPRYWYVDPAVAVLFSVLIIRNWLAICWEQAQKMIGLEAPEELIEEVTNVTQNHCPEMQLDRVTAYHHGSHMVVEVEVLLPPDMTVRESHDIALALQHKIEGIDNVERAFVHVDYERRTLEEHKVERNLKLGEKDVMRPLPGYESCSNPATPGPSAPAAAAPAAAAAAAVINSNNNSNLSTMQAPPFRRVTWGVGAASHPATIAATADAAATATKARSAPAVRCYSCGYNDGSYCGGGAGRNGSSTDGTSGCGGVIVTGGGEGCTAACASQDGVQPGHSSGIGGRSRESVSEGGGGGGGTSWTERRLDLCVCTDLSPVATAVVVCGSGGHVVPSSGPVS